jgi:hypothetical protein
MATEYRAKLNPFTGQLQLVPTNVVLAFKAGVATQASLPLTLNSKGDARLVNDTGHLYVWSIEASSGLLTDWVDAGDIVDLEWDSINGKPSSSVANIDDAVSLKHTQGTDQALDTGGLNEISAANAKAAYTHSGIVTGNPHAVTKSEVGLGNVDNKSEATIITDVKADSDVADAISKKHDGSHQMYFSDLFLDIGISGNYCSEGGGFWINWQAGIAYISGIRVISEAETHVTMPANKDTYAYLKTDGTRQYISVNNGAEEPEQPANTAKIYKIVTNDTEVTALYPQNFLTTYIRITQDPLDEAKREFLFFGGIKIWGAGAHLAPLYVGGCAPYITVFENEWDETKTYEPRIQCGNGQGRMHFIGEGLEFRLYPVNPNYPTVYPDFIYIRTNSGSPWTQTEIMRLTSEGNLGIGTFASRDYIDEKLTVLGNIKLESVDPEIRLIDTGDDEYTRITRSDTDKEVKWLARTDKLINIGNALNFNNIGNLDTNYDANIGGYSFYCWFRLTDTPPYYYKCLLSKNNNTGIGGFQILAYRDNTDAAIYITCTYAGGAQPQQGGNINDTNWHLLVVTLADPGSGYPALVEEHAYLDNVEIINAQVYINPPGYSNYPCHLLIGKSSKEDLYWEGDLDEAALFNRVLTSDERNTIWNSGAGTFANLSIAPWNSGLLLGYHFDEESGTVADNFEGTATYDGTVTSGSWVEGKIIGTSTHTYEADVLKVKNGVELNESNIVTLGDDEGRTIIQGKTIRLNVDSSERLTIDEEGVVNVFVTSVQVGLRITAPLALEEDIFLTFSTGADCYLEALCHPNSSIELNSQFDILLIPTNNVGIGTTDLDGTPEVGKLTIKGTTNDGSTNILVLRDSDEVNVLIIDTDGKIGIGTVSPAEKLEVVGKIASSIASDIDFDTDEVLSTGIVASYGLLIVRESTSGITGTFRIENQTVVNISSNALFAIVKDNASTYNVYWETDQFKVQNKVGDNKNIKVGFYGL